VIDLKSAKYEISSTLIIVLILSSTSGSARSIRGWRSSRFSDQFAVQHKELRDRSKDIESHVRFNDAFINRVSGQVAIREGRVEGEFFDLGKVFDFVVADKKCLQFGAAVESVKS
jgi:hypothetical protein